MRPEYILVVGHGRSGTNFLLRLLNLSPITHCRNEPNELSSSPFRKLPCGWFKGPEHAVMDSLWDDAIRWTAERIGERDPRASLPKQHLYEIARRFGGERLTWGPRLRGLKTRLIPSARSPERLLPRWLGRRTVLREAVPVLKLLQVPGWAAWILAERPSVPMLHIVRHPGGFLNSWRNRYLAGRDPESVRIENIHRLERLCEVDTVWRRRLGSLEEMAVEESELWYWRYATETVHEAGEGSSRYHMIHYEELASNTVDVVHRVYGLCGLPWDSRIEDEINRGTANSRTIVDTWRKHLSHESLALIDRILEGSPTQHWWNART